MENLRCELYVIPERRLYIITKVHCVIKTVKLAKKFCRMINEIRY
jgi:hypothetical protein